MRIDIDQAAVDALYRLPGMRDHISDVTDQLMDTARAGSPHRTGHFASSYGTSVDSGDEGRPIGHLHNRDPGATAIEVGSIHNPPFAPMRRAARALGLELKK